MASAPLKYCRKFRLVSVDDVHKNIVYSVPAMPSGGSNIHGLQVQAIGQAMQNVLERKDLSDQQKVHEYNQQQYQYFNHRQQMNPTKPATAADADKQDDLFKSQAVLAAAVGYFQKLYREKAIGLGQLLNNTANIQWNERGEVIIDSKLVHGSSLLALMDDVVRRKASAHPVGYLELADALKKANVPTNLVGETTGVYKVNDNAYYDQSTPRPQLAAIRRHNKTLASQEQSSAEESEQEEQFITPKAVNPKYSDYKNKLQSIKRKLGGDTKYSPHGFLYKPEWQSY